MNKFVLYKLHLELHIHRTALTGLELHIDEFHEQNSSPPTSIKIIQG
uniref:Uncharacterized protein n=1 Tax=Rhizophora mucronata TaxID=61149 RepID=A0A2P2PM61_RHIMU